MKQTNILILLVFLFSGCNIVNKADEMLKSVKIDPTTSTLHTLLFSTMHNQDVTVLITELQKMGFTEDFSNPQATTYNNTKSDSSIEITFLNNQEIKCIIYNKKCTNSATALDYFLQWSKQNRINKSWYNFKGIVGKQNHANYTSFLISISNDIMSIPFYHEQASDFCFDYMLTYDSLSISYQIGHYQYPL